MRAGINKRSALAVVAVGLVALLAHRIWHAASNPAAAAANTRILMDAETGELIAVDVADGFGPFPAVNPDTGRRTLYPTEVCYANDCAARGGTRVILNRYLGKERPTYCPNCGAEVRFHNPGPVPAENGGQ
jgi:hypothetical protein